MIYEYHRKMGIVPDWMGTAYWLLTDLAGSMEREALRKACEKPGVAAHTKGPCIEDASMQLCLAYQNDGDT